MATYVMAHYKRSRESAGSPADFGRIIDLMRANPGLSYEQAEAAVSLGEADAIQRDSLRQAMHRN